MKFVMFVEAGEKEEITEASWERGMRALPGRPFILGTCARGLPRAAEGAFLQRNTQEKRMICASCGKGCGKGEGRGIEGHLPSHHRICSHKMQPYGIPINSWSWGRVPGSLQAPPTLDACFGQGQKVRPGACIFLRYRAIRPDILECMAREVARY